MSTEAQNNDYACPFYFSFHPDLDRTTGTFQSRVSLSPNLWSKQTQ